MARPMNPENVKARAEAVASLLWECIGVPLATPAHPIRPSPDDFPLWSPVYYDQRRWAVTGILHYNSTSSNTPPPLSDRSRRDIMATLLHLLAEHAGASPEHAAALPECLTYLSLRLAQDVAPVLDDYRRIFQGVPRMRIVPLDAWLATEAELWARYEGTSRVDAAEQRAEDAEEADAARVRFTGEQRAERERASAIDWFATGGRERRAADATMAADLSAVSRAASTVTGADAVARAPRDTRGRGSYAEQGVLYTRGCRQARARAVTHAVEWAWQAVTTTAGVARLTPAELAASSERHRRMFAALAAALRVVRRPVCASPRGPHADTVPVPQFYTGELTRNPWNHVPAGAQTAFRRVYLEPLVRLPILNWSDETVAWALELIAYCYDLPVADWEAPRRWMLYDSLPVPETVRRVRIPDEYRPLRPYALGDVTDLVPGGQAAPDESTDALDDLLKHY